MIRARKIDGLSLSFEIVGADRLDPILVTLMVRDHFKTAIVTCWDRSWHAHWSATGGKNTLQFILDCDLDYLVSCFSATIPRMSQRDLDRETSYLRRVIAAVRDGLGLLSRDAAPLSDSA